MVTYAGDFFCLFILALTAQRRFCLGKKKKKCSNFCKNSSADACQFRGSSLLLAAALLKVAIGLLGLIYAGNGGQANCVSSPVATLHIDTGHICIRRPKSKWRSFKSHAV